MSGMADAFPLVPAERRVAHEICAGRSNDEIARHLGKAIGTVKNQVSSVYRKLGVGSRVQLMLRCGGRSGG